MTGLDPRLLATLAHNLLGRLDHLEQTLREYRDDHANTLSAAHGLMAVVAELPLPVELHLLDEQVIFADRLLPVGPGQRAHYQRLRASLGAIGQGGVRLEAGVSERALTAWMRAVADAAEVGAALPAVEAGLAALGLGGLQLLPPRARSVLAATEEHHRWRAAHALLRAGRLAAQDGPLGVAALQEAKAVAALLLALPPDALRAALVAPVIEPAAGLRASRRAVAALVLAADLPVGPRATLGAAALLLGGRGSAPAGPDAALAGLLELAAAEPLAGALAVLQQQLHAGPAGWTHPWAGVLAAAELWGRRVADGPQAAAALDGALPVELGAAARAAVRAWPAPA